MNKSLLVYLGVISNVAAAQTVYLSAPDELAATVCDMAGTCSETSIKPVSWLKDHFCVQRTIHSHGGSPSYRGYTIFKIINMNVDISVKADTYGEIDPDSSYSVYENGEEDCPIWG